MARETIGRLDSDQDLRERVLPLCRLAPGEVWEDPVSGHRVGCLDAAEERDVALLMRGDKARMAVQDPPYNIRVGGRGARGGLGVMPSDDYIAWSRRWVRATLDVLADDAHLYVWLGGDQRNGFQPLPDFMCMMREFPEAASRSFITMRNQRGYGTQKNWMAVRQELLYYVKGNPDFHVEAEYTDIPKKTGGYRKVVGGRLTGNLERGRGRTVRAGNVWTDVQQVFYRRHENVPGCYAQKPLKALERILASGARRGDLVVDFFTHSGATLVAAEQGGFRCATMDADPVFAEIAIRRLERLRATGQPGWQWHSPFPELAGPEPSGPNPTGPNPTGKDGSRKAGAGQGGKARRGKVRG